MKTTSLEKVIYFQDYVVIDPGRHAAGIAAAADRGRVSARPVSKYRRRLLRSGMGAEAVRKLLPRLDLDKLEELRKELVETKVPSRRPRT
jgi:DNA-directed RNA polymerase subunit beta'